MVSFEEVATPKPRPTEVLLRVGATSLNHLDLWVRRGLPFDIPLPHIGGSDLAGSVEAVGTEVSSEWIGKRVVVDPSVAYGWYDQAALPLANTAPFQVIGEHTQGGMAEFAVVPSANLVALPDHVSYEAAAAGALAGVTAWRGLMSRGELRAGERVLVTGGSGGVSTMAIQFAAAAGARVTAITSSPDRVDRVIALGAETAYNRTEVGWEKALWKGTEKRGFNLCLDSVGPALWPILIRSMAVGGRLVTYGATTGHEARMDLRQVFWKQLSILGSTMGSPAEFRQAMALVFQGDVAAPIHTVMPLAQAQDAHALLEDGQIFGKIVLKP